MIPDVQEVFKNVQLASIELVVVPFYLFVGGWVQPVPPPGLICYFAHGARDEEEEVSAGGEQDMIDEANQKEENRQAWKK